LPGYKFGVCQVCGDKNLDGEVFEDTNLGGKKKSPQRDDVFCTNYEKAIT
jgi:hypothetical protein